jgi:hypothetical protein
LSFASLEDAGRRAHATIALTRSARASRSAGIGSAGDAQARLHGVALDLHQGAVEAGEIGDEAYFLTHRGLDPDYRLPPVRLIGHVRDLRDFQLLVAPGGNGA